MEVISSLIVGVLLGFLAGYFPLNVENIKLKKRPLTYYECLNIKDGTDVLLLQYGWKKQGSKIIEHGTVYTREDGHKCINVYDGDIEFTQADVWLKNQ